MKCRMSNFIRKVRFISDKTRKSMLVLEELVRLFNEGGFEITDYEADLTIFIGGDGTFIDGHNLIDFSKETICLGINTGKIGILSSYKGTYEEIVKYLSGQSYVNIRKIPLLDITISNKYRPPVVIKAANEVIISGKRLSLINYSERFDDIYFQRCNSSKIIISSTIDYKNNSQNYNSPVLVNEDRRLVRDIIGANHYKLGDRVGCLKYRLDINTIYDEAEIQIDGKIRNDIKADEILSIEIRYSNDYINILDLDYIVSNKKHNKSIA